MWFTIGLFKNWPLIKNPQFLSYPHKSWWKWLPQKMINFTEFHEKRKRNWGFFINCQLLNVSQFFFPQTLFSNLKFRYRISYSHIISWLHSNTFFQKKTLHSKIQSTASNFEITLTGSNEHPWFFKTTVPKFIWFLKVQTILFV